jgi:hypothetical protein
MCGRAASPKNSKAHEVPLLLLLSSYTSVPHAAALPPLWPRRECLHHTIPFEHSPVNRLCFARHTERRVDTRSGLTVPSPSVGSTLGRTGGTRLFEDQDDARQVHTVRWPCSHGCLGGDLWLAGRAANGGISPGKGVNGSGVAATENHVSGGPPAEESRAPEAPLAAAPSVVSQSKLQGNAPEW